MLGQIIKIVDNKVYVKLSVDVNQVQNLINLYAVMQDNRGAFIGEIMNISDGIAQINLIGEYRDNNLIYGFIKKPSFNSKVSLLSPEFVGRLIGNNDSERTSVLLGHSPFYDNVNIYANINKLFGTHFAIFGNTGAGKSCGFARIIQNLFLKESLSSKMNLIIFDAYGEYHNAFKAISNNGKYEFKAYSTEPNAESDPIVIPAWFLDADDLAIMLNATKKSQIQIIEKTLRYVTLFKQDEEKVITYKNNIIASAMLDILQSGKPSSQIRDQIIGALSKFYTKDLNLESTIYQPGYSRTLRQCLLVDENGKINAMETVSEFFQSFLVKMGDVQIALPDGSFSYSLMDVLDALEIALIDEGIWKSDKVFDEANILKVRLQALINSDSVNFFAYPKYIDKATYINNFLTARSGRKAQIINLNINSIDDRLAKTIVKIYSKLFFNYAKDLPVKASMPFNIILEEAHRYVQNDSDIEVIGYNIFERITKEGRKYGVLLGLISQRPCELSETVLSQCSNFITFKISHPRDLDFLARVIPNITAEIIQRMNTLESGFCMSFGTAFKVPALVQLDMPDPEPNSASCDISNIWFE